MVLNAGPSCLRSTVGEYLARAPPLSRQIDPTGVASRCPDLAGDLLEFGQRQTQAPRDGQRPNRRQRQFARDQPLLGMAEGDFAEWMVLASLATGHPELAQPAPNRDLRAVERRGEHCDVLVAVLVEELVFGAGPGSVPEQLARRRRLETEPAGPVPDRL